MWDYGSRGIKIVHLDYKVELLFEKMIKEKIEFYKKKNVWLNIIFSPISLLVDSLLKIRQRTFEKNLTDREYFLFKFRRRFGYELPLDNPQTYNEKIQWRKLYEKNPLYTLCADKWAVRDYIKEKIGEEYLIPLVDICEKSDDLNFDKYPENIVLKCTHDCGSVVLMRGKNKVKENQAKERLEHLLGINYYMYNREWHYKNIVPKIIVEEMIMDDEGNIPFDLKFHVFNGKTEFIQLANASHTTNNLYTSDWQLIPVDYLNKRNKESIPQPIDFDKMIEIANTLGEAFNYVRVDLYNINGKVYFGELTFTPNGGYGKFDPKEYDLEFGKKFNLDEKYNPVS